MMKKINFLKPLFFFFLSAIFITTVSRGILVLLHKNRITQIDDYWMIFLIGLRMDLLILSYISFLPAALLFLLPDILLQKIKHFFSFYFITFLALFLFMELVTRDFIHEYDTRPNKLFIDYLIYPKEVFGTLFKSHLISIISTFTVVGMALYFGIKKYFHLFTPKFTPYFTKIALLPLVAFLLFFGSRSSLTSKRPFNASNAIFSSDQMANSLGLNSLQTVLFALYSTKYEADALKIYGYMDENECIRRVKKYMDISSTAFIDTLQPLKHVRHSSHPLAKPYNLVIFLEESLGAEYVGSLGGLPLTPFFDQLAHEGLLFTNLYCTGIRSVRGIEAVVTGFLPSPSESIVKLPNSQTGFYTLAADLKEKGYETSFIYGGMANFDNMGAFFNGNGFSDIIDEPDYKNDQTIFKGVWGYCDEDLVVKANNYFKSKGEKPFFSLMFSTSNHGPFEFPDGKIELFEHPKQTGNNAIKYADFAIGKFFELAKKEAYFEHTIFIVIADHNTRTYGEALIPVNKFHIPALIIGPGIEKHTVYDKLCSQIDIPPTLLSLIGVNDTSPMPGRNLLSLPENVQYRAIMQFHDNYGFRVGNTLVVLQPNKKPEQFELSNDYNFISTQVDSELAKDALAHVNAANFLYKKNKYRLH